MIGQLLEAAAVIGLQAAHNKHLRETFVPKALTIARAQGWVSAGRLHSQLGLTRKDALTVLAGACQQGLIYQADNGRFYVCPAPQPTPEIFPQGAPTLYLQDLPAPNPDQKAEPRNPGGRKGLVLAIGSIITAIAAVLIISTDTGRRRPVGPVENATVSPSKVTVELPLAITTTTPDALATIMASPSQAAPIAAHGKHHPRKHKSAGAVPKSSGRP